jgi:orotidine-5'-phosphate decarboxylase
MKTLPQIYCAMDLSNWDQIIKVAGAITPLNAGLKLGLEFFTLFGADGLKKIKDQFPDASLFLDLKFHDIPNTVANACKAAAHLDVDYINLHALGGSAMMMAAKDALKDSAAKLLAVTILTSSNQDTITETGQTGTPASQVMKLAALTHKSGLDGIVCSAHEIAEMRKNFGLDFVLMVPGIRPAGADAGDQKRVMTPKEALDLGATHLVIGRPITGAENPAHALNAILESL